MAHDKAVRNWLRESDEDKMLTTFPNLVKQFGLESLKAFVAEGKNRPMILHELVRKGKARVLRSLVTTYGFSLNVQREDGCTPLHLASWNKRESMKEELLQLGADPSICNAYGEMAAEVECHSIRPRLQRAATTAEILQLVECRISEFDAIDVVCAFHLLADKTAHYEASSNEYQPRKSQVSIRTDPSFGKLVQACVSLINEPLRECSQSVFPTLLKAMVMLREESILRAMAARIGQVDTAQWEAGRLTQTLWGIAKVDASNPMWTQTFHAFGDILAVRLRELSVAMEEVTMMMWAYGRRSFKHSALFSECIAFLKLKVSHLDPQVLSTVCWTFAKTGFFDQAALGSVGNLIRQTESLFTVSQDVSNTAWALAKLQVEDASLFQSMFCRATQTMYSEQFKNHVCIAKKNRAKDWAQVFVAYMFCLHRCPEGLENMNPRLLHDLRLMGQMRSTGRVDGTFSDSSGLNHSERCLRELDRLIESMEKEHSDPDAWQGTGYSDSLEAQPMASSAVLLEAAEANARLSQAMVKRFHDFHADEPRIVLLSFSRCPECFRHALLEGPAVADVRAALHDRGYEAVLACGMKVFVHPEQYESVREAVQDQQLRGVSFKSSQVVVAEDLEGLVVKALQAIPSSQQVRLRETRDLPVCWDEMTDAMGADEALEEVMVKRTFIHVSSPNISNTRVTKSL
ncbi:unnamed protein product [Symbiodinium sp. CCMP2592]|nr:unnamed protein product [Symbiodinium sp. CCMP2592]